MRTTEDMILMVPAAVHESSLALGMTRARSVLCIVCRTIKGGLVTSILLAVARTAGETRSASVYGALERCLAVAIFHTADREPSGSHQRIRHQFTERGDARHGLGRRIPDHDNITADEHCPPLHLQGEEKCLT